jgi:stearoyl-CoA desaturase (Delta-9 desaturase)
VRDAPSSPSMTPAVEHDDMMYPSAIPFFVVHLACVAAFWTGVTSQAVAICLVLYWLRIFAIGAGYHRYFSHRAYRTSRVFQFILAFLSQSSAQERAVVGVKASSSSLVLGHSNRHPLAASQGLYL